MPFLKYGRKLLQRIFRKPTWAPSTKPEQRISRRELVRVTNLFNSFANSTTNALAVEDLRRMLRCQGMIISDEKLAEIHAKADVNRDGLIQFNEFLDAFEWLLDQERSDEELLAVFEMIDLDRSGIIKPEEMLGLLTTTKEPLSNDDVVSILYKAGQKDSGGIDFEGFKKIMRESKSLQFKLMSTYRVVFIIGGPGAGKGTYCKRLTDQNPNLVHVSTGDLLREAVKAPTALAQQLKLKMMRGELLDAGVVVTILDKFLAESPGHIVLLDGFPRRIEDSMYFYEHFGSGEYAILFDCPDEIMVRRIIERGKLLGRLDDTEKAAWERIRVYHQTNELQLEFLKEKGINIYTIDTSQDIESNIEQLLDLPLLRPTKYRAYSQTQ